MVDCVTDDFSLQTQYDKNHHLMKRNKPYSLWSITGISLLIIAALMLAIFAMQSLRPRSGAHSATMSWAEAYSALLNGTNQMNEILHRVQEGDLIRAQEQLDHVLMPMWKGAMHEFSDQYIEGLPLKNWIDMQRLDFDRIVPQYFDRVLQQVGAGQISPADLEAWLETRNQPALYDQLDEAQDWIIAEREAQASGWYRIVFENPAPDHLPSHLLLNFLTESVDPGFGYQLVLGPALSEPEQAQTWNTLVITGAVQTATFKTEVRDGFRSTDWTPRPLIIGFSLYPREVNQDRPTSWAVLEPIHVWLQPPKATARGIEDQVQQQYRSRLLQELKKKLHRWPNLKEEPSS